MKLVQLASLILFSALMVNGSCKKKTPTPNPPTPPPAEQNIVFTHNAGNNVFNPGATLNFAVTLTSAMPASGIKVEISTVQEANGAAVSSSSSSGSTAVVNVSVTGLIQQVWCVTTIKVSSVATPTNSATQTFRVVYK